MTPGPMVRVFGPLCPQRKKLLAPKASLVNQPSAPSLLSSPLPSSEDYNVTGESLLESIPLELLVSTHLIVFVTFSNSRLHLHVCIWIPCYIYKFYAKEDIIYSNCICFCIHSNCNVYLNALKLYANNVCMFFKCFWKLCSLCSWCNLQHLHLLLYTFKLQCLFKCVKTICNQCLNMF